jgi:hypothetical protein
MKFPRLEKIPAPLLLFIVTLLAYGPLVPFTGFYWDDWPYAWIAHFLGLLEFFPASLQYRPFLAPNYALTIGLISTNPLAWQAFGLLIRFLTGLSAWFALTGVWPARKREALTASLLFLIFPGYSQQWVALTHVNQELIPLLCYLLSFGLTARALREPSRFWRFTIPAILLHIIGIFQTEYFFGMEIFRFFFIWAIISESTIGFRSRLIQTLKRWWPYLLVWLANAAWLVYFYKYGTYNSYDITPGENTNTTAATLTSLIQAWGDALFKTILLSWTQVFGQLARVFPGASSLLAIALIVVTFGLLAYIGIQVDRYTSTHAQADTQHATRNSQLALFWILTGFLGILAGRIPSWLGGLPLTLQSSYDRFMVSMMLGAALFITGLLELIRHERLRTVTTSLLIALAVGGQFLSGNVFRRDWEGQRALYWQFAWRIPALEPGTILFTHQMPLDYETDLSMTAPLNWIYAPNYARGDYLPYILLYTEKRLGGITLPNLEPDTPITVPYRTVTFRGSPGKSITVFAPRDGCLRVLDPVYANAEVYAREPRALTDPIAVSDPSLILVDAPAPEMPSALFGPEPAHTWCYFYEQAELARQRGDWESVTSLGDDAARLGFGPQDVFEWLPFIEAYARLGRLDEAEHLSRLSVETETRVRKGVCQVWGRVRSVAGTQAGVRERSEALLIAFDCTP